MEIMSNPIILLAITFGIYYVARQIQKWTGWIVLNPILITIAALIALLQLTGISYETYEQGGQYIDLSDAVHTTKTMLAIYDSAKNKGEVKTL